MPEQDVETVRGGYEEFNCGSPQGVLDRLHEEVEWVEPGGGNAPSGTFNGVQSVADDVIGRVPQYFDEFQVDAEEFEDQGDTIVVKGRFTGTAKSGAELDTPFEHAFTMRDGKIARLENRVADQDAWAAAWS
jgi:ketosteroid isomerase-like protein